jgi:hypothetical protein
MRYAFLLEFLTDPPPSFRPNIWGLSKYVGGEERPEVMLAHVKRLDEEGILGLDLLTSWIFFQIQALQACSMRMCYWSGKNFSGQVSEKAPPPVRVVEASGGDFGSPSHSPPPLRIWLPFS